MFSKSAIPNPALSQFETLIGEWKTEGTHPMVPGTVFHGDCKFEWLEGGAFLMMRSSIVEAEIPDGISIFGSDDDCGELYMLYFDERKVSRKYEATFDGQELKWWRNSPRFSQRFTLSISADGNTIQSHGEMSRDGKPWEKDLSLTYHRKQKS